MTTYKLTDKCPKYAIIRHLPGGENRDYSNEREDIFAAMTKAWKEYKKSKKKGFTRQDLAEIKSTFKSYTREGILQAAVEGRYWPIELGFVEEIKEGE